MQENKTDNIYQDAIDGISEGVHICRTSVDKTIGGQGTNVTIKQEFHPYYIQTKDAFSIIQAIKSTHPLHRVAVDMMKDATDSMNKRAKDGRTTMCILTDEILLAAKASGKTGREVEKELNAVLPLIEQAVDAETVSIVSPEGVIDLAKLEGVATTAADSERIGKLVASIYATAGKDCIINHIEASGTWEDNVSFTEGVRFMDTGFLSPYMVHDEEAKKENRTQKRAVYYKPTILVTKRKIMTEMEIMPLIKSLLDSGKKDLIIFTDDMDSGVATTLVNTHKEGVMNICIIKAPVLWKEYVFEDFAKVTGSTIVEDATGVTWKNLSFGHLGTCGKIVIDKEEVIISGIADISEHLQDLRQSEDKNAPLRLWWLNTKTATLKLGATNEGELSLLRLKAQDSIHSAQLALQGGVVKGGGMPLYFIANNQDSEIFKSIIGPVLQSPLKQIAKNGGMDDLTFMKQIPENILDAAIVTKNAVRNAIGIAVRVLTGPVFLDLPKLSPEEIQLQMIGKQRNPFA